MEAYIKELLAPPVRPVASDDDIAQLVTVSSCLALQLGAKCSSSSACAHQMRLVR